MVLATARVLPAETVEIDDVVGRVLAETIRADRDLPPIDRVTMDGIAINFKTWFEGARTFSIAGVQAAGMPQGRIGQKDACLEVMTGSPLPAGADTVVPYEEVRIESGVARITTEKVSEGQHIHRMGTDARSGASLLHPGTLISAAEVALLAAVGKERISVFAFPSTAVVSSGDELVEVGSVPLAHQVRRSNAHAILAAMKSIGWSGSVYHLPDDKQLSVSQMKSILAHHDTVILSGGVSKGRFDFIPEALEANGIVKRFHRVHQRPGKPFWFGTSPDGAKTIFALPGNPVSTYLCFYRYVRPWMLACHQQSGIEQHAVLAQDVDVPAEITYFLQVDVRNEQGQLKAYPQMGGGSGDLANLKDVTGFLEVNERNGAARKGSVYRYFSFRFG